MPEVVGFCRSVLRRFTCYECGAIVEYRPREAYWNGQTDEEIKILGLYCPNCGVWHCINN